MIYGYARVSTNAQDLASQLDQLTAAGAVKVFQEKASGAKRDRAFLTRAIKQLGVGDVLTVTRLDRLARSTVDLLNILEAITKQGAAFKSLADTCADTTTPQGRLLVTMLGGMAEFERSLSTSAPAKAAAARSWQACGWAARPRSITSSGAKPSRARKQANPTARLRAATACTPARFQDLNQSATDVIYLEIQ